MTFEELFEGQTRQHIASRIRGIQALKTLFGAGYEGARDAQARVNTAGLHLLTAIDHDTAIKYHELARRSVEAGRDRDNVQAMRQTLMELALKYQLSR